MRSSSSSSCTPSARATFREERRPQIQTTPVRAKHHFPNNPAIGLIAILSNICSRLLVHFLPSVVEVLHHRGVLGRFESIVPYDGRMTKGHFTIPAQWKFPLDDSHASLSQRHDVPNSRTSSSCPSIGERANNSVLTKKMFCNLDMPFSTRLSKRRTISHDE